MMLPFIFTFFTCNISLRNGCILDNKQHPLYRATIYSIKKTKKKSHLIVSLMNNEWFFLREAHSLKVLPMDDIPEYIFWGRSNVGKSSLINLLTKKSLAKTSKTI